MLLESSWSPEYSISNVKPVVPENPEIGPNETFAVSYVERFPDQGVELISCPFSRDF